MPGLGWRCDEIFLYRVDGDKIDRPRHNDACFAGQINGMFGTFAQERVQEQGHVNDPTGAWLIRTGRSPAWPPKLLYSGPHREGEESKPMTHGQEKSMNSAPPKHLYLCGDK